MKHDFARIIKQKSGVAIMSVMLFFMVMMIMIGGLTISSQSNAKVAGESADYTAAFYAAEAGINRLIGDIETLQSNQTLTLSGFIQAMDNLLMRHHNSTFTLAQNNGANVTVNVRLLNYPHNRVNGRYFITAQSSGRVDTQVRTIQTQIEVEYGRLGNELNNFLLRHAVLVRNNITTGNATISPVTPGLVTRVATISSDANAMNLDSGLTFTRGEIELTVAGKANVANVIPIESYHQLVNNTVLITESRDAVSPEIKVNFPVINFSPIRAIRDSIITSGNFAQANTMANIVRNINGVQTIVGGNYRINHLDFSGLSGIIRIDSDVFIIANRITFGNVSFSGDRMLSIYVSPSTTTQSNFDSWPNGTIFGRLDEPQLLAIYVDTVITTRREYDIIFPNNSRTFGYFMFNNANIQFANNSKLFGSVFTGAVDRTGRGRGNINAVELVNNSNLTLENQRSLIVAPNGTVGMMNGSSLTGAIVANNAILVNQSRLTFDPNFPQRIPFDITSPIMLAPSDNFGINRLIIHRTTEN